MWLALQEAQGSLQPVDWIGLLSEPKAKLQSFWFARLQAHRKRALLASLGTDDQVDLRSAGGPGAGSFLEPPEEVGNGLFKKNCPWQLLETVRAGRKH